MPDAATFMAFLAAVLAMQAVPGPDTMLVVSRGVGQGRVVAVATALGAVAAGLVQLPLLAGGVASLVRSSPLAFDLLRYAGAAFLVWLGLGLLLRRGRVEPAAAPRTTARAAFDEGLVSNLTNPNVLVFMLAFLPQFVDPAKGSVMGQMLLFGAVQKLSGLLVLGGTAFAAGSVGDLIARRPGLVARAGQIRFFGAPCAYATSPSSPTSTTARRRSSTSSCRSRGRFAPTSASRSAPWTRTTSRRSAASPFWPRRPRWSGRTPASTSSTRPATPISAARSSASSRWSTASSCSSTRPKARCRRRSSWSQRRSRSA